MGVTQLAEPRPSVPLPGRWTFWADTMVGGQILGMVDVASFYCVRRLSAFGHGNVTLNLPCGLEPDRILNLWSWRLWAFYDGEPYWCGVPTGLADQDGSAHVQLTLIELPGYLTRRQWEHHPDKRFTAHEQTDIARDIAEPVQDVGVVIETDPGPGRPRDRRYEFLEGGSRGQLLINLTGVIEGPEFRTDYRMATGRPVCVLRIGYPRVGGDTAGLGLSVPGAILRYRAQFDSDSLRTVTYAVGDLPHDVHDEDNPSPPRPCVITRADRPELPQLDMVDDWPGTVLEETLRERAETAAATGWQPGQQVTGSPHEAFPAITTYGPGDTVTVRAVTPLAPRGTDFDARLLEVEVNAATGIATWTLARVMPPAQLRESVAGAVTRLDTAVAAAFHSGGVTPIEGNPR
jgi:hypothetical protein